MKPMFNASMMCMDLLNVKSQIEILNKKADMCHVDIMDGHFVRNLALSPDFLKIVRKEVQVPIDCHLMVTNPEDYIERLAQAGADYICPHAETINTDAFRIIDKIKSNGCKVGVVLNPATPISYIQTYIHLIDKLTIMNIDPGFAGQPFIKDIVYKYAEAKKLREERGYKYIIESDGSCNKNTFKILAEAGAECFVMGSTGLFNQDENLEVAWDKMVNDYYEATNTI